ncbi:hypothetical protein ASF89_04900 [Frigoribacterium sp. Leaf172]|nr:hypothetical protein ASF89_04900 [Frigoribacterium sp. Leaf172]
MFAGALVRVDAQRGSWHAWRGVARCASLRGSAEHGRASERRAAHVCVIVSATTDLLLLRAASAAASDAEGDAVLSAVTDAPRDPARAAP